MPFRSSNIEEEDKDTMRKKELALAVIERLKEAYPDAGCTLDYNAAWERARRGISAPV